MRSKLAKRALAFLAVSGFFLLAVAPVAEASPTPSPSVADSQPNLSTVGKQAFHDVSTCLTPAQGKALDVFYLIDTSGSLKYTDKAELRKTVISNSVQSLGRFIGEGAQVSWAAALFSNSVTSIRDWQSLPTQADANSAANEIGSYVNNKNAKGFTDWEGGLRFAESSLNSKPAGDCKVLIWFTDGGINPDGTIQHAVDSLARLCNSSISSTSLGDSSGQFGLIQSCLLYTSPSPRD